MKHGFQVIALLIILISCQNHPENTEDRQKGDSIGSTANVIDFDSMEEAGQRMLDTNYLFLDQLLDTSLKLAYRQGFNKPFTITVDTNTFSFKHTYATISFGHLFSADRQHLIIRRFINEYGLFRTSLYTDIFLFNSNSLNKVASDTSDNGYDEDRFEDVNHDSYPDYVVQSYSEAGCCPRNFEMAYVYNPQNGHFETTDFFNREKDSTGTFFFETSYGRDNFVNLYKYKWKGLEKVLLEEIYVTPTRDGYVNPHPSSYTKVIYPTGKKQKIKKLPEEYARLKMAELIAPLEN